MKMNNGSKISITEERPPDPMVARPTIVARTSIRSVKVPLAIDPARHWPAAALMAIAILFTDDFDLGYSFRTRNRVRLTQDRHGGSRRHVKNGRSCKNRCFDQCRPLWVPRSLRAALAVRILEPSAAPINRMTQPQAKFPARPSTFRGTPGRQGYFRKSVGAGSVDRQALPKQKSWTGHTAGRILQGYSDHLCSRQPHFCGSRASRVFISLVEGEPHQGALNPARSGQV
jgi:hypothetical protein